MSISCTWPQYLHRFVARGFGDDYSFRRLSSLSFCFFSSSISSADSLLVMTDMLFSCEAVVSLLLQMSRALAKVSWRSWRSFFLTEFSRIPRTTRSRSSDSCRQVQKLQVCASVRRAVTYCSIVSPSFSALLLKTNRSYVSFVSPMKQYCVELVFVFTGFKLLSFVYFSCFLADN